MELECLVGWSVDTYHSSDYSVLVYDNYCKLGFILCGIGCNIEVNAYSWWRSLPFPVPKIVSRHPGVRINLFTRVQNLLPLHLKILLNEIWACPMMAGYTACGKDSLGPQSFHILTGQGTDYFNPCPTRQKESFFCNYESLYSILTLFFPLPFQTIKTISNITETFCT